MTFFILDWDNRSKNCCAVVLVNPIVATCMPSDMFIPRRRCPAGHAEVQQTLLRIPSSQTKHIGSHFCHISYDELHSHPQPARPKISTLSTIGQAIATFA